MRLRSCTAGSGAGAVSFTSKGHAFFFDRCFDEAAVSTAGGVSAGVLSADESRGLSRVARFSCCVAIQSINHS